MECKCKPYFFWRRILLYRSYFCIEKDKIVKTEIKSLAEAYSNIIWSLMTSSLTPTFINANFKEFVEQIKKNLPPYATINSHYLLPLGEIDKDHRATHSIFRGETLLNSLNFLLLKCQLKRNMNIWLKNISFH